MQKLGRDFPPLMMGDTTCLHANKNRGRNQCYRRDLGKSKSKVSEQKGRGGIQSPSGEAGLGWKLRQFIHGNRCTDARRSVDLFLFFPPLKSLKATIEDIGLLETEPARKRLPGSSVYHQNTTSQISFLTCIIPQLPNLPYRVL